MKVNRNIGVKFDRVKESRPDYNVKLSKSDLFEIMWDLTRDQYSFIEDKDAERRLQRNVSAVIRRKS